MEGVPNNVGDCVTQEGEGAWNEGRIAADTQGGINMQHEAGVRQAEHLGDIAPKLLPQRMWPALVRALNPHVDDDCGGRGEGKGYYPYLCKRENTLGNPPDNRATAAHRSRAQECGVKRRL